jgi:hypothetical protein
MIGSTRVSGGLFVAKQANLRSGEATRRKPVVHESWTGPDDTPLGGHLKVGTNTIQRCPGRGR